MNATKAYTDNGTRCSDAEFDALVFDALDACKARPNDENMQTTLVMLAAAYPTAYAEWQRQVWQTTYAEWRRQVWR